MRKTAIDTLFHYFNQNPDIIKNAKKIAFIRAQAHAELSSFKDLKIEYFQSARHLANQLQTFGINVKETLNESYDLIIYLPTKSKEENLTNLGIIAKHLEENGKLICSVENELGSDSFRKKLKEVFGNVESESKFHCKVLISVKDSGLNKELAQQYYALKEPSQVSTTPLVSVPGVFSHSKVDQGSKLLAETLPKIHGRVADFGAGYGFLSYEILEKNNHVDQIDLYENEKLGLDCCKINLKKYPNVKYFWFDLTKDLITENYDFIISNPPFHEGKTTSFSLALSFLDRAKIALKNNGTLLIVGKEHLPYHKELATRFKSSDCLAKDNGYNIWIARK